MSQSPLFRPCPTLTPNVCPSLPPPRLSQIIFNTKNEIAKNLGILLAWVVVSLITTALATWLLRRNAVNAHRKGMGEKSSDEKAPGGPQV